MLPKSKAVVVVVVLALAAFMFAKFNTSKQGSSSESAEPVIDENTIEVEGGMFYFKPDVIKVKKGERVKIAFKNIEGMHDFVIDELNVASKLIGGGEITVVEFTPDQVGSFEYYCSVSDHRAKGMKGTLIVEE